MPEACEYCAHYKRVNEWWGVCAVPLPPWLTRGLPIMEQRGVEPTDTCGWFKPCPSSGAQT